VLKISPAAQFSEHFLGCHFTKILLSGHFPQQFRLRCRLTFIFSLMLVQGPLKSKLPGAREDLNPALVLALWVNGQLKIFHYKFGQENCQNRIQLLKLLGFRFKNKNPTNLPLFHTKEKKIFSSWAKSRRKFQKMYGKLTNFTF
jgi:hypothetical protein